MYCRPLGLPRSGPDQPPLKLRRSTVASAKVEGLHYICNSFDGTQTGPNGFIRRRWNRIRPPSYHPRV